jgi:hypothetical protein
MVAIVTGGAGGIDRVTPPVPESTVWPPESTVGWWLQKM